MAKKLCIDGPLEGENVSISPTYKIGDYAIIRQVKPLEVSNDDRVFKPIRPFDDHVYMVARDGLKYIRTNETVWGVGG